MTVVLTIRGVPDFTREMLAREARHRGQSLQSFLLSVLQQQATFAVNRELLWEVEGDVEADGGADESAPDAAEVLARERAGRTPGDSPSARKSKSS